MSSPSVAFRVVDPRNWGKNPLEFNTFKETRELCGRISHFASLSIQTDLSQYSEDVQRTLRDFAPFVTRGDGHVWNGLHRYLGLHGRDPQSTPELVLFAESERGDVDGVLMIRGKEDSSPNIRRVDYLGTARFSPVPFIVAPLVDKALKMLSPHALVFEGTAERMNALREICGDGDLEPAKGDERQQFTIYTPSQTESEESDDEVSESGIGLDRCNSVVSSGRASTLTSCDSRRSMFSPPGNETPLPKPEDQFSPRKLSYSGDPEDLSELTEEV